MKNVVLIHGFNGVPKIYEWLKAELEKIGVKVTMPVFPPQEGVVYEKWEEVMTATGGIDNNSIVICHSIGNEFLIKYLMDKDLSIDTYIGLAGFADVFEHEEKEVLNLAVKKFLVSEAEIQFFIKSTKSRYAIYSDDDHLIPFEVLERYPKIIEAEPILIPGVGHMGRRSGLEEFPQLFDLVKSQL